MPGGLDETSSETFEIEGIQAQQGALVDYMHSAAEVVSQIKEAKEDVQLILSLLADEGTVVEGLIEALTSSDLPFNRIPLEPSSMPEELGAVEAAHLTSGGSLIVSLSDEEVFSFDLSLVENRGLLVCAMGDLVPKLHGVLDGTVVLPELAVEEPVEAEPIEAPEEEAEVVPMPVPEEEQAEEETVPEEAEEPIPEELLEEAVVEPEVDEPLEEAPEFSEPIIEEMEEAPVPAEEDGLDEPMIEEPGVEELALPEFEPDAKFIETPDTTREEMAPPEKPVKPPLARDAQVKRLRNAVRRQRSSAHIEMEKVRRQREAQIRRLRITNGMDIPYVEEGEGLLDKVRGLLSRRRRRR